MSFRIRVYEGEPTRIFISKKDGEGFTIKKVHEKWEFSHFWTNNEELLRVEDISIAELTHFIDLNELLELL